MAQHREWCICCGKETDWVHVVRLPAFLFGLSARIEKCKTCGFGKTVPAPAIGADHYRENVRYETLFAGKADLYKKFARDLLGCLPSTPNPNGAKLLDIGCGGGFLVETANELGFAAQGIEANSEVVAWARSRGLDISQGDVMQLPSNSKFDVVVLSAVLEHMPRPDQLLSQAGKLLRPRGRILISQASYDGLLPRVMPWTWYGWQPAEHFWHFTPVAFAHLVSRTDMQVEYWCRNSLYHPWFFKGGVKTVLGRNVAALVARLGNRFSRGDSFNMIVSDVGK